MVRQRYTRYGNARLGSRETEGPTDTSPLLGFVLGQAGLDCDLCCPATLS